MTEPYLVADWANAGAMPAAANPARASVNARYLLALKRFLITHLLLTTIAPSVGPKGTAASCCVTDCNTGKRAVFYDWGRHNFLRALTEFVNMRRGTRKSIKLAFLALSKLDFFFCAAY